MRARTWETSFGVVFVAIVVGAAMAAFRSPSAGMVPSVPALVRVNPPTTALIEVRRRQAARKGKPFEPRMVWTPLDRISPNLVDAVVAAEDDGFYRHRGVEWKLLRDALLYDLQQRRWARGASTITQQLAKNLYLTPSKNPLRKGREMLIAFRLERHLPKRRILELYLNAVEWGNGVFGAEAAARAYFGKSAATLTLDEAVALAAVIPSPRRHSPLDGSRWVSTRKDWVVRRMVIAGRYPGPAPSTDATSPAAEPAAESLLSAPPTAEEGVTAPPGEPPPPPEPEEDFTEEGE